MTQGDPNRALDRVVFWVCLTALVAIYTIEVHDYGYRKGLSVPKQCASVPGQQVVSTTAETCTYAAAYGRATTKRRAG